MPSEQLTTVAPSLMDSGVPLLQKMSLLATFSVSLAVILSVKLIVDHLRKNHHATLQRCILRMLYMVPLFAIDAWVCLFLERKMFNVAFLSSVVRDTYESVVLISFLQFLLIALGQGDDPSLPHATALAKKLLSHKPAHCKLYQPINFIPVPPWLSQPGPGFVLGTLIGVLQYAAAMLIFLFFRIKAFYEGFASVRGHKLSLQADGLKTVSCGIAMYHLVLLACNLFESKSTEDACHKMGMHTKFLCIKGIILFVQFQHFVISVMVRLNDLHKVIVIPGEIAEQTGDSVINFLLCMEILLFAFWHFQAYPAEEFNTQAAKMALISALGDGKQKSKSRTTLQEAIKLAKRAGLSSTYRMDLDSMSMAIHQAGLTEDFDVHASSCHKKVDRANSIARARSSPAIRKYFSTWSNTSATEGCDTIHLQRLDSFTYATARNLARVVVEDASLALAREALEDGRSSTMLGIGRKDAESDLLEAWQIGCRRNLKNIRFLGFVQTCRDIMELWDLSRKCSKAAKTLKEHSKSEGKKLSETSQGIDMIFHVFTFSEKNALNKFEFHFLWSTCIELEILRGPEKHPDDESSDFQWEAEFEFNRAIQQREARATQSNTGERVLRYSDFYTWCSAHRFSSNGNSDHPCNGLASIPIAKTEPAFLSEPLLQQQGRESQPLCTTKSTSSRQSGPHAARCDISPLAVGADQSNASMSTLLSYVEAAQHLLDVQQRALEHLEERNERLEQENYKLKVERRAYRPGDTPLCSPRGPITPRRDIV